MPTWPRIQSDSCCGVCSGTATWAGLSEGFLPRGWLGLSGPDLTHEVLGPLLGGRQRRQGGLLWSILNTLGAPAPLVVSGLQG